MVFALGTDGVIEYMPENSAPVFKERRKAGEEFSCLVPDCPSQRLSVVDRGNSRRHGFSHISGGGHDEMGVAHLQCQLLIQRWLTEKYPSLDVELEMTTADGRRRADVMATSRSSGAQIAFEVQYASMSPAEWQERHDSYAELGIIDVWLWGYRGAHFHEMMPGWLLSNPTLAAVGGADQPILWIDPTFEHIGYTTRAAYPIEFPNWMVLSRSGSGSLRSEPLSEFRIDADRRFLTDQIAALLDVPAQIEKALEQRRLEQQQRRLEEEEQERRRKDAYDGFYNRVRKKSEANARVWAETSEHRRIIGLFGVVPDFLKHVPISGKTVIQLPVPPVMWQGSLYLKYIHGRREGWRVSIRGMTEDLERMDPDVRLAEEAVRSWLDALEQYGHVARLPSTYRYDKWPKYEVRTHQPEDGAEPDSAPGPVDEPQAESAATRDERDMSVAGFLARPGLLLSAAELRSLGLPVRASGRAGSGQPACIHCLGALGSSTDKAREYHSHCASGLSRVLNHPLRS